MQSFLHIFLEFLCTSVVTVGPRTQCKHKPCVITESGVPAGQNIVSLLSAEQEIVLYKILYSASTGPDTEREKKAAE